MLYKCIYIVIIVILLVAVGFLSYELLKKEDTENMIPGAFYDENGNQVGNINSSEILNITHIIAKSNNELNVENVESMQILYTLDADQIVINSRNIKVYDSEENAKLAYKKLLESDSNATCVLDNNIVIYNDAYANGMTKDELIKSYENGVGFDLIEY